MNIRRQACGCALVLFGATVGGSLLAGYRLAWQPTPSAPQGLWLIAPVPTDTTLTEGDWIAACVAMAYADLRDHQLLHLRYDRRQACVPVIKRVWLDEASSPPPTVEADAVVHPRTKQHLRPVKDAPPLMALRQPRATPRVWLTTPYGRSFDSRYFGAVEPSELRGRAYPLVAIE